MKHLWNYLTIVFVLLLHATVLLGVNQSKKSLILDTAGVIDDFVGLHYIKNNTLTHATWSREDAAHASFLTGITFHHVAMTLILAPMVVSLYKRNWKRDRFVAVTSSILLSSYHIIQVCLCRDFMRHALPPAEIPTITHFSLQKTIENGDDQYHCRLAYHGRGNQCVKLTFPYRDGILQNSNHTVRDIADSPPCCPKSITTDISSFIDRKGNSIYERSTTGDTSAAISKDKKTIVQASIYKSFLQSPFMNPQYQVEISIHSGSKPALTVQSLYLDKKTQSKLKSYAIVGTAAALMFLGNRSKK